MGWQTPPTDHQGFRVNNSIAAEGVYHIGARDGPDLLLSHRASGRSSRAGPVVARNEVLVAEVFGKSLADFAPEFAEVFVSRLLTRTRWHNRRSGLIELLRGY